VSCHKYTNRTPPLVGLLDPQRLIIDQDRDGLPPEDPIHVEAK
jgi:hypothetical protein